MQARSVVQSALIAGKVLTGAAVLEPGPLIRIAALPKFNPIHLREWRKARGLTLTELASLAGIDHGNLSKLERGIFPYSQSVLEKLANALSVSPAIMLSLEPDDVAAVEAEMVSVDKTLSPETRAAWSKICKIHKFS